MCSFDVCASVCVCVCARSGPVEVKCYSSKTVKATDFKFDTRIPRDSSDLTPQNFPKRGRPQKGASVTIYLAEICTLTSAF